MWSDVCKLGNLKRVTNAIGDLIEEVSYSNVDIFCNMKSIKASEFYQANAVGMKPEMTLELMRVDYNKEKYVLFEDERYKVLRTYITTSERIELTLVKEVNDGNS